MQQHTNTHAKGEVATGFLLGADVFCLWHVTFTHNTHTDTHTLFLSPCSHTANGDVHLYNSLAVKITFASLLYLYMNHMDQTTGSQLV